MEAVYAGIGSEEDGSRGEDEAVARALEGLFVAIELAGGRRTVCAAP